MATNDKQVKGYNHQFVEPPPDDLLCLFCTYVARDPQQINCCGILLCSSCLEQHKKNSTKCPKCKKDFKSFPDAKSKFFFSTLDILHIVHVTAQTLVYNTEGDYVYMYHCI